MPREVIRMILMIFLIFFLASDLMELISYLTAASPTLAPFVQRLVDFKNAHQKQKSNRAKEAGQYPQRPSTIDGGGRNFLDPASRAKDPQLSSSIVKAHQPQTQQESGIGSLRKRVSGIGGIPISFAEAEMTGKLSIYDECVAMFLMYVQ
jgi:hypothetical protein